jgi:hypothetical protein
VLAHRPGPEISTYLRLARRHSGHETAAARGFLSAQSMTSQEAHVYVIDGYEDFELMAGTPPELWLGVPGEAPDEQAARLDAARDILAAAPELADHVIYLAMDAFEAALPGLLQAAGEGVAW